jgi:hypothetical protein
MSRRIALLAAAAAALSTATVVLASAAADSPAPQGERILRLVEHEHKIHVIDHAPRGRLGSGDQAVVRATLVDERGARFGSTHALCTVTGGGRNPSVVCTGVAVLRNGTLAVSFAFRFEDRGKIAAVTGGTGAYAGARGWLESRSAPGGDPRVNQDVIHLLP